MKIDIVAVGSLKSGPEYDLVQQYIKRLLWRVNITEIKAFTAEHRREGYFANANASDVYVIALDEHGDSLSSEEFAHLIDRHQKIGTKSIIFCIGAAEGLPADILARAHQRLCFGRMTWPHLLVRGLLIEQLYRAQQILKNHPYHKI